MFPTYSDLTTMQRLSYLEGEVATARAAAGGLSPARPPSWAEYDADARALITWPDPRLAVVTFQGTKNVRGWWRNFKRGRVRYLDAGKVHRGILHSWLELEGQVMDAVASASEVIPQGHSAGGMIAAAAAGGLMESGFDVPLLYSCGKGRVVNRRYGRWLRRHPRLGGMVRCVKLRDPIPFFPLLGSSAGIYQHETGADGVEDGARVLMIGPPGGRHSWDPDRWARWKLRLLGGRHEPQIEDLPGVSPGTLARLREAGLDALEQLLSEEAEALVRRCGISLRLALRLLQQAEELSSTGGLVSGLVDLVTDHGVKGYQASVASAGI